MTLTNQTLKLTGAGVTPALADSIRALLKSP
jgi:hypothetical protein